MTLFLLLCAVMVGTSFLSGIFGMAGGLILVGVLLAVMPLPDAMALHAVTQIASNGWRTALWIRHVRWRIVAAYAVGCLLALGAWSLVRFVPEKPWALLGLGASPFLVRLLPRGMAPDAESPAQGVLYGTLCMALMLLTGVAGPLADSFFLGGKLERRQVVATKSMCQTLSHALKLVYFAGLIDNAGSVDPWLGGMAILASMAGTTLARRVLEGMSDASFRLWGGRIITAIGLFYLAQGAWLLGVGP